MSKALPNPGTYRARLAEQMVLEQKESGSLLLWIPYIICDPNTSYSGKHMMVIGKTDGQLKEGALANLKKIFPDWDGQLFSLEEIPVPETEDPQFELADCFHDEYEEGKISFKANWLNPLGGSMNMPSRMDEAARKSVLATWGAKIRASVGAKPVAAKPAAAAKSAAAASKPSAPSRPGAPAAKPKLKTAAGQARSCSQDECWNLLLEANGGEQQADIDALTEVYWGKANELYPDNNGELTPVQWGAVAEALGV